jgi:hypothetical protein
MAIALLVYFIYLIFIFIVNAAVIYHVLKYRYPNDGSIIVIYCYGAVLASIIIGTFFTVGVF